MLAAKDVLVPPRPWAPRPWLALAALGAALAAGALTAFTLARQAPPYGLELGVGVVFIGVVALAVVRVEAAAFLALALLGVVVTDPAPADFVFLILIALAFVTGRFRAKAPPGALVALGGFLTLSLLSAVEVVDHGVAALYLGISIYLAVAAVWLSGFVDSRQRARVVAGGYLTAAVASAAMGVAAVLAPVPGKELLAGSARATALFQDPNVFGPFLVPIALILLEDLLSPRLFRMRALWKASLLGLLALGVIFSYSRGAWLNLAVGTVVVLLVLALRRGGARHAVRATVFAGLVASLIFVVLAASGSTDFLVERARIQEYDSGRFAGQVVGIESAERYPLGIGPGQFESYASISAHSTYIRAFAEQGLPGLILICAFLFSTLAAAIGNAVSGRQTYGIGSAALLGALCGILVNSAVIDTLHWRHFWIVVALIWAGWARRKLLRRPPVPAPVAVAR